MWNSDVVAGNWYEADGQLFRETPAPLSLIPHHGGGGSPVAGRSTGCVSDS